VTAEGPTTPTGSSFAHDRPIVVAHRGSSATHPENTLASFGAAIEAGADAVEFDVRLTADGHAVVMHDPDVHRTTSGAGLVRSMTLAEVRRLRIASPDGPLEAPTLQDALSFLSGRVGVDIEIKNIPGEPDFDPEGEPVVAATLRGLDETAFAGAVIVSSFNPMAIARSRASAPDVPTGLLTTDEVDAAAAAGFAAEEGHAWVLPSAARVAEAGTAFPARAHEAGLRVGTWVVDDPVTAVALFRTGLDAVATNDPATIVAARRRAGV
jgi:glycerophosphoryl diester phosphodiesterase